MNEFVKKDERLAMLLRRLRDNGAKVFLLTNSDYKYTNKIMQYLLESVAHLSFLIIFFVVKKTYEMTDFNIFRRLRTRPFQKWHRYIAYFCVFLHFRFFFVINFKIS